MDAVDIVDEMDIVDNPNLPDDRRRSTIMRFAQEFISSTPTGWPAIAHSSTPTGSPIIAQGCGAAATLGGRAAPQRATPKVVAYMLDLQFVFRPMRADVRRP